VKTLLTGTKEVFISGVIIYKFKLRDTSKRPDFKSWYSL